MRLRPVILGGAFAAALAAPAIALHNHLTKSIPAADAVLARGPTTIRLWFSERPTPAFSSITLLAADSTRIPTTKPRATDDTLSIIADISAPVVPGKYLVTWRTAGDDGHAVRGKFGFSVKP
jgi:hypothetical protein